MSEPRVAALVCEGQTDVPVLEAVIQEVWPSVDEVLALQPELDEHGRALGPAGWSQVRAWCEQNANRLGEVLDPLVGSPIDLVLVAIDVDIAIEAGIVDPPREVGAHETTRLRRVIRRWLQPTGRKALPNEFVVSTPVMAIEAWIIAALFPKQSSPETIRAPAEFLVTRKKLRRSPSDQKPWKEVHRYRRFADDVASKLKRVRRVCPEAERTCHEIAQLRESAEK